MNTFFNIDIELMSSLLIYIVIVYTHNKENRDSKLLKYLDIIASITCISLVFDSISTTLINGDNITYTPFIVSIMHITTMLPIFLSCALPVFWSLFLMIYVKYDLYFLKSQIWALLIPLIGMLFLCIASPFTGWVYKLFEDGQIYQRGPLMVVTWLTSGLYMIYFVVILIYNKKSLSLIETFTLFSLSFFPLIGLTVQANEIELLYFQPCIALSIILAYILLSKKMIRVDYITKAWTQDRFNNFINYRFSKGRNNYILSYLELQGYGNICQTKGREEGNNFLHNFSRVVLKLTNKEIYLIYLDNDQFIVFFDFTDAEKVKDFYSKLEDELAAYNTIAKQPIQIFHSDSAFILEQHINNKKLTDFLRENVYQEKLKIKKELIYGNTNNN